VYRARARKGPSLTRPPPDTAMRLAVGSAAGLTPLTRHPGLASQPTQSRCTAMLAEPANLKVLREPCWTIIASAVKPKRTLAS